jgi:hypothetical protein
MNPVGVLRRPGFVRSIIGMVAYGVGFAFLARAFGQGGYYGMTALLMIAMGLLLLGVRGALLAIVFHIPAHLFLHFPIATPSDPFFNIFLTLSVYLGVVPAPMIVLAYILKRWPGVVFAALAIVPAYATFLVAFPFPGGPGVVPGTVAMFAGFGITFGYLWGMGAVARGASSHEGPAAAFSEAEAAKPKTSALVLARESATKLLPYARENLVPMIRPLLTSLGVITLIVGGFIFVAMNPIVRVSRVQTENMAANVNVFTLDKFLTFVIFGGVIIGGVISLAVGLALILNVLNGSVNVAKKEKNTGYDFRKTKIMQVAEFGIGWVVDLLNGLRKGISQRM